MKKRTAIALFLWGMATIIFPSSVHAAGALFPPLNPEKCTDGTGALVWTLSGSDYSLKCMSVPAVITNKNCAADEILSSITNGVISCVKVKPMINVDSCAPSQVATEIQNGQAVCVPNPIAISCPADQVMKGLTAAGAPVCMPLTTPRFICPSGTALTGITSGGTPLCSSQSSSLSFSCPTGKLMTGFVNNQPVCATP